MNQYVKVLSTSLNSLKQRLVKFLATGKNNIQTSYEVSPYGTDSNPIKGMVAIYGRTADTGQTIILGYINKNLKAAPGEYRTFATDADGEEKFYTWMKANGTIEIGGDTNFAVKFNELKTEFNKLKTNFNNHITEYNLHVHPGVTSGASSTLVTTPSTNTNTSNIDDAKNDKIKTI